MKIKVMKTYILKFRIYTKKRTIILGITLKKELKFLVTLLIYRYYQVIASVILNAGFTGFFNKGNTNAILIAMAIGLAVGKHSAVKCIERK
jgi:hypothetical protein